MRLHHGIPALLVNWHATSHAKEGDIQRQTSCEPWMRLFNTSHQLAIIERCVLSQDPAPECCCPGRWCH
jgi:hypothetical protein